ncbi:MAG: DUF86 domain-containing protein [Chloroflexi bacterium]|nr:DUF86 domain-containing protein [Chloroflexota bacterium]
MQPDDQSLILDTLIAARQASGYVRHRLVHDYRRINRDIVWATVHDALPGLIAALGALAPPPED